MTSVIVEARLNILRMPDSGRASSAGFQRSGDISLVAVPILYGGYIAVQRLPVSGAIHSARSAHASKSASLAAGRRRPGHDVYRVEGRGPARPDGASRV